MTTYPLATLAAQVTSAGITAPSYNDIYTSLQTSAAQIYGSDTYLDPDSQDGQMLAIYAKAQDDSNQTLIVVYNSYSPTTSLGAALSSNVKINGLKRLNPSNSSVNVNIIGVAGTIITNGVIQDANNNLWNLPATVTIPISGVITVTAVAQQSGAITAPAGTVTQIVTNTRGWQTVNNLVDAVPGAPVENDPQLKQRQTLSTANPAQSILESIVGSVAQIPGVQQIAPYENDTRVTDNNGLPGNSISLVVEGGDATTIAQTIALKKTPGTGTYGNTKTLVIDSRGVPVTIAYFVPTQSTILVNITIKALNGYTSTIGSQIIAAIVNYINALGIGGNDGLISLSALMAVAYNTSAPSTYNVIVSSIQMAVSPNVPAAADLAIAFNVLPICQTTNVNLTVTS